MRRSGDTRRSDTARPQASRASVSCGAEQKINTQGVAFSRRRSKKPEAGGPRQLLWSASGGEKEQERYKKEVNGGEDHSEKKSRVRVARMSSIQEGKGH